MAASVTKGKTIAFVTGTRADFGKIEPLAREAVSRGFTVKFFVTGMHMRRRYGDTRLEVRSGGLGDCYEYVNQSDGDGQDAILIKTMRGFGDWFEEYPADLVVVHGDRVEAIAVAMLCAMRYIPCAHIEGGEVSGTIDEIYRHCNTKLCRYHFVSSKSAATRVISLGEHPDDVFVIGSPELDRHRENSGVSISEVKRRYEIPFSQYGIVLFHPVTSELDSIGRQASSLFRTLTASNRQFVVICPNNDPGSEDIFRVLRSLPASQFRVIPSMRFAYFSELMKNAAAVIGNSSMGVREAPFLGLASLNVGTRQHNRSAADSITNTAAEDAETITMFLNTKWGTRYPRSKDFGQGNAAKHFGEIISSPGFWNRARQKVFYERPEP